MLALGWVSGCLSDAGDLFSEVAASRPPPAAVTGGTGAAPASEPEVVNTSVPDAGEISTETTPDAAGNACGGLDPSTPFEARCLSCAGADGCSECLCGECTDELEACSLTPGCLEILSCAQRTGCVGIDCYCGSFSAIACATVDEPDGPCVEETLSAPGARTPSFLDPSTGPASDAALAVADCMVQSATCSAACFND